MNRNLYRSLTENSLSYFFPNSSLIIAVVVVVFFFSLRFLFSDTVINLLIFSPLKFCYRCRCLFVGFFFFAVLTQFLGGLNMLPMQYTVINLLIFSPLKFCYRCRCLFVGFFFFAVLTQFLGGLNMLPM